MKRSRFFVLLLLLTATGLLAGGLIARAKSPNETPQDLRQLALKKISPWVMAKTADGQEAEFLVMLGEQADLSLAHRLQTKEEKGRYVFNALRAKAESSQPSLLNWLTARNVTHQSFYIVNAVMVKGSRELATEIAARPDVASIAGNPEIQGVRPVQLNQEELLKAASAANAPEDVELGISQIRATEVWATGFTGQGIVIGGQDTGVEWSHPALKNHYRGWDGANANHDYNWHDSIHEDNRNCGKDSAAPCDDDSHGTHTLGSAIGSDGASNQIGVAPGAKFIACRNMNLGNGKPSTYLECIEWLLAPYPNGATPAQGDPTKAPDITTNSWTCPPSEGCEPNTLKAALEAHRAAGILTVAAAGNSGAAGCSSVKDPPGIYDAVYTVGAISAVTGTIASFSGRGPVSIDGSNRTKPDITAPGVLVRSAIRGGSYTLLSGTSMATPHVAGAVALLWSARPELRGKIDLTENILNESAVRVLVTDCGATNTTIPNAVYGYGRLDVKAAVDLAATTLDANEFIFGVKGGAADITVAALPSVTWRAVSDSDWITVTAGQTGTGFSAVFFKVAANTSSNARTGTLLIAGRTVRISQPGVAPLFAVSGKITSLAGMPMPGVTLSFSRVLGGGDVPGSVLTDGDGNWSQSGFEPGTTYRVSASRIRSTFSPASLDFNEATSALDFSSVGRTISR